MTQTAEIITFTLGQSVFNTEFNGFERVGQIVDKNGELKVATILPETGKLYTVKLNDKWQALPETAPKTALDAILELAERRGAISGESAKPESNPQPKDETPKDETPKAETFEPLSETELADRKKLVADYKRQDANEQNAFLRKCEIIHEIRTRKLFRNDYPAFNAFAVAELQVHEKYAQNLAQIGEFYAVAKPYIKENKLSVNAINQLIRAQNKLAANLGMSEADLSDFAPVIEKVIETTINAAKNEKGKIGNITPRIVDTVAGEIQTEISNLKSDKTGKDLIALAAETLGAKAGDILSRSRETLNDTGKDKTNGSNGTNRSGNGESSETYTGVLSNLEIKCTLHADFKGNKILVIGNGTIQTKCLCRFKQVGFDLVPYEINGKKVKAQS